MLRERGRKGVHSHGSKQSIRLGAQNRAQGNGHERREGIQLTQQLKEFGLVCIIKRLQGFDEQRLVGNGKKFRKGFAIGCDKLLPSLLVNGVWRLEESFNAIPEALLLVQFGPFLPC